MTPALKKRVVEKGRSANVRCVSLEGRGACTHCHGCEKVQLMSNQGIRGHKGSKKKGLTISINPRKRESGENLTGIINQDVIMKNILRKK